MNAPNFWRLDGHSLGVYQLRNQAYIEVDTSPIFPILAKVWLDDFLGNIYLKIDAKKLLL